MYSLKNLHTFGLNSSALKVKQLHSLEQCQQLVCSGFPEPLWVLGEGSNSIFTEDFNGLVLHNGIKGISLQETPDAYIVEAGAGENWHSLVKWCLARGIFGFENLALIPGTVGAAPIQNIGAYGVEVERYVKQVEYICLQSKEVKTLNQQDCQFAYRDSIFKNKLANQTIITKVTFRLPKQWVATQKYAGLTQLATPSAMDIYHKVLEIRQAKLPDPKEIGNAGSFFKNPTIDLDTLEMLLVRFPDLPNYPAQDGKVKLAAAWLIDKLGFKGKRIGGIGCHPSQALVLTNTGNGSGEQLLRLAREIKQAVLDEFAVTLENEVRLVGATGLISL